MFCAITAGGTVGFDAHRMIVETDISSGLPCFELVGSVGGEVKEARERVRVAMQNSGLNLPVARITVNIAPADIKKDGTAYDLAIAAGLLVCMGKGDPKIAGNTAFLGELALNGEIRQVRGVLPILRCLKQNGIEEAVVAAGNTAEAELVEGIRVLGFHSLKEVAEYIYMPEKLRRRAWEEQYRARCDARDNAKDGEDVRSAPDFADVCGQETARRAAEVAAAGFHHLLMSGAPGGGKTMIASRIPGILPPLSEAESLECACISSITGTLREGQLPRIRPFVAPHHTSSPQAMAGGGRIPGPGMISKAHRGVLFLDEMPEFSSAALETLRQPMEDKKVQIARAGGLYVYPAEFMLVCAMNPCPCGYFPDRNRCSCTETEIRRYMSRVSGPILDRIDMIVETSAIKASDLQQEKTGEPTAKIRERVMEARERQEKRYRGTPYRFNSELSGNRVKEYCGLGMEEQRFLENVYEKSGMSVRGYHKLMKLSRTIADLDGSDSIKRSHLTEAVVYNLGRRRLRGEEELS